MEIAPIYGYCLSNSMDFYLIYFPILILVPLTEENFAKWKREFYENDRNVLAQNVCSRADPMDICLSRKSLENTNHVFAHKV